MTAITRQGQRKFTVQRQRRWTMSALLLPSIILIGLINAYPVVFAAVQSVQNGSLISSGDFVGFDNYLFIFKSATFWNSALFTLIYVVVGVLGSFVVGLALALAFRQGVPFARALRVLFLLPWVVPVVVTATSWIWLTSTPDSLFPLIAKALGFGQVAFLSDPVFAGVVVCVFKIWASFPFCMLMMTSALEGIDPSVREAAEMDGATRFQELRLIILPIIARPIYICWILMAIFCVNDFQGVYLLTAGGPVNATTTLVVYAYRLAFQNNQIGLGVAVAFFMTAILTLVSIILYRRIQKSGSLA